MNPRTPAEWGPWQEAMQAMIDALRRRGRENVLLVPGTQFSRSLAGAPPLDDPLGQLGYAVHPYLGPHNQTRAQWEKKFGDFARTHPVMATEFNAQAGGNYCRPELAEQAEALLAYLRRAADRPRRLGARHAEPARARTAATRRSTTSSAASAATAARAAPGR